MTDPGLERCDGVVVLQGSKHDPPPEYEGSAAAFCRLCGAVLEGPNGKETRLLVDQHIRSCPARQGRTYQELLRRERLA